MKILLINRIAPDGMPYSICICPINRMQGLNELTGFYGELLGNMSPIKKKKITFAYHRQKNTILINRVIIYRPCQNKISVFPTRLTKRCCMLVYCTENLWHLHKDRPVIGLRYLYSADLYIQTSRDVRKSVYGISVMGLK